MFGAVEVFLEQGVRSKAGPAGSRKAAEFLPRAHDVNGVGILVLARLVGNGES